MNDLPLVRHLHNLRDVGGVAVGDSVVRRGVLYRSAAPLRESAELVGDLQALGVRSVLDLRDDGERALSPEVWAGSGLTVRHVPVFENHLRDTVFSDLAELYDIIIERHGEALAEAFTALAHSEPPTLVHCTAGKDRTGLLVGLALSAVGVADEGVLADYGLSERMLGDDYLNDLFSGVSIDALPGGAAHRAVSSPPELLAAALRQVRGVHGSVRDFFVDHGVSPADLELLRRRLVE